MANSTEALKVLHKARQAVVLKISELNASHIKSEMRRAGLEIDLTRCREALEQGNTAEDFNASISSLEEEFLALEKSRDTIDSERNALNERLQEIDQQMSNLD
ncbi:MAG: hypothetical protein KTR32_34795 [Granulosicoccus sp.]|nr:hypothetical protein [Granulosicoccus sp.]